MIVYIIKSTASANVMGSSVWRLLFVVCLTVMADKAAPSQEIIHKVTKGFIKVFEQCKNEKKMGDQVMQDFFNFWKEEYELLDRDLGCMVLCMASKFDLIDEDMKMHHGNVHEFAKTHGADDDVAQQIVMMIHNCETLHIGEADHCLRLLEVSKCFRTKINQLKWTPSMEVILEEIMTSI